MNGDLADAFIFEPVQCLGQALKPLCLGLLLLLEKMDNAFAVGRGDVTLEDVVWAVAICSQDYGDGLLKWIGSGNCEKDLKSLGLHVGQFDIQKKTDIVSAYFEDGMRQPKCWTKDTGGTPKADWKAHLFVALMADLHASPDDILKRPLRGWLYLMLTHQERQGVLEIHGEHHRDLLEMAKRMESEAETARN
jgi:hypothetical protein